MVLDRILCGVREKITINIQLFTFSWYVQTASECECPYLRFIFGYSYAKLLGLLRNRNLFLFKTVLRIKIRLFD